MIKENCFAYSHKHNRCNALLELNCEKCKFFKTVKQLEIEENMSLNRFFNSNIPNCYRNFKSFKKLI